MNRRDTIETLLGLNLNIIPLRFKSKDPSISWKEYQTKKYTETITPELNIGIVCGEASGNLEVIDIDFQDKSVIDQILPNALSETLVVKTGKGGYHIYIRTKKLTKTMKLVSSLGRIDIQSQGSYVVGPSSVHPNGNQYEIISEVQKIASVDFDTIIQNLNKLGFKMKQKPVNEIMKGGIEEGNRHDAALRYAGHLLFISKLEPKTVQYELERWNDTNKPPLPKNELNRIVQDAINYHNDNHDEPNNIKKSVQQTTGQKGTIRKVKGRISNYYVESILVDDKPHFLCYSFSDNSVSIKTIIDDVNQVYQPIEAHHCGYFPYSFTASEITELLNEKISKEFLLDCIKCEIDRFISLTELGKHLVLGDIFLTYCQEWISTIHYPFFVGETESGKSSVLHLLKWLGYRCMFGEDIPQADVYNFLGSDEEGCGTIAEDEAQELWRNLEKIRMYKSSYAKGSVKARIVGVDSLGKHQVFYKTFCPKWFAGEKLPTDKGFSERLAVVHMTEGKPASNIKRLTDEEKAHLNKIRNMLLVWKIQNIGTGIKRTESGLVQRDQELWEDYLSVVHGTKYYEKCKSVVSYYMEQRHEVIKNSLEARIFRFVMDMINEEMGISFKQLWYHVTNSLPGSTYKSTFHPEEYTNKITYHSLSKLLEDKFQAKRKQLRTSKEQITSYKFNREVIETLIRKYGIELPIDHPFHVGTHGTLGIVQNEPSEPNESSTKSSESSLNNSVTSQ